MYRGEVGRMQAAREAGRISGVHLHVLGNSPPDFRLGLIGSPGLPRRSPTSHAPVRLAPLDVPRVAALTHAQSSQS